MRAHEQDAGQVRNGTSFDGLAFCSFADSLLPDEEESEEDELGVFYHLFGDVEVHVPRGFGFDEGSVAGDSAVGFDDDGFRVGVYELKEVGQCGCSEVSMGGGV